VNSTTGAGSQVYLIGALDSSIAKIGISRNVNARLATLQTGSPTQLRVLATAPGGAPLEHALHDRTELRRSRMPLPQQGFWSARPPRLMMSSQTLTRRLSHWKCEPPQRAFRRFWFPRWAHLLISAISPPPGSSANTSPGWKADRA
jgi:hypothetical protein